ncbi:1-acyl-sn-glycerol-3-phosphate acyltransferase [Pedobacter sp. AK017]|uniref:lysophospholipid acyltransferase family protein n=1 Tax=Pedobacter sp. AK017 TaxID=2723073 RepID=UPI00161439B2|nr:lysophospholipid acyltransferase family protein [Pedobacter sp. AK017]MBB5440130.1 1-acyl-sn-glycerol-3-phosphate acyltransferase [Pedobacter sp. AK017]
MNKFLGYIFSPLFYIFFGLVLVIFHPIQWICYRFFGYRAHKAAVDLLNFFLTYSDLLLGSSITFLNQQQLPTDQPIIFVANHQSMYDIPGLIWFLRKYHVKFISKIELTKGIPSISYNLKYGGGANIDRKDSKQAVSELIKLGRRMKEHNWSAMIFAEGTRAKDGQMKNFQVGGIATLLKVVPHAIIVPVAIENSWKLVQYGAYPLSFGEKLRWTVLKPLDITDKNPEEIVLEAENAIRSNLNQLKPAE